MTRLTKLVAAVTLVLLAAPGAMVEAATTRPGTTARTTMGHAGVTTGARARGGAASIGTMGAPAHRSGPGGRR